MNSINSPNFSDLTAELKDKLRKVKLFLCDVDGVLTDGTVMKGEGMDLKRFPSGMVWVFDSLSKTATCGLDF